MRISDWSSDVCSSDLQNSSHARGRAHGGANTARYNARIAAMNYTMEHDEGASMREIDKANVIRIAPSRRGKTQTSLYMALQPGILDANFPLTEEERKEERRVGKWCGGTVRSRGGQVPN